MKDDDADMSDVFMGYKGCREFARRAYYALVSVFCSSGQHGGRSEEKEGTR